MNFNRDVGIHNPHRRERLERQLPRPDDHPERAELVHRDDVEGDPEPQGPQRVIPNADKGQRTAP